MGGHDTRTLKYLLGLEEKHLIVVAAGREAGTIGTPSNATDLLRVASDSRK